MPPQGSHRRTDDGEGGADDGVDRLTDLPEELRLQILGCLGSVREAACTNVLSRPWRGLWTGLPELTFRGVGTDSVEAALARLAGPALDLLDVHVEALVDPERISPLLRAAARLAPKALTIAGDWGPKGNGTINLPCLDRTASLTISMWDMSMAPPPAGEFAALTSLSVVWCDIDLEALLPLCPCLRVLVLHSCIESMTDAIVHLPLLEELDLKHHYLEYIDIEVKVQLLVDEDEELSVSFSAPMPELTDQDLDFAQAIAQLPFANFSDLDLNILAEGHAFRPMVFHLLRIRPVIQRLRLFMEEDLVEKTCSKSCPCEQPNNWRSEIVALTDLEVVEIAGLKGEDHEIDFLELLLRCATVLKRMTVRLSDLVSPSKSACKKIRRILKEYPNVECDVYCSCRDRNRRRPVGQTVSRRPSTYGRRNSNNGNHHREPGSTATGHKEPPPAALRGLLCTGDWASSRRARVRDLHMRGGAPQHVPPLLEFWGALAFVAFSPSAANPPGSTLMRLARAAGFN
ncbi:putative F-box/FBD/LRR-repeat protein [Panicum miliaceum]|uniref:F-box/FBD/LRR-repeat protein n=1 Tax=Panicum miliaceum TaxID=4540 RepID=A0A3L6TCX5_PANMI|nr:putative F-box/FBD/LRR-repeat protein [Panicum miliaceum]